MIYRLKTATHPTGNPAESFSYDSVGNRTDSHLSTSYTTNELNRVTEDDEYIYGYDNDGNMTQGYTPDGYQFTATYDAENRLTSAEYTDSGSVLHRTEYYYSGDSMLAKVEKYEDSVKVDEKQFIRAGFLTIQERDGSNSIIREYTWGLDMGGGIGGLLNLNEGGSDYSYLYDGKGNVMVVIDGNQQPVASYRYDAFGVPLKKVGTFDQPFRFSTKRYDEKTGLSYYGYRFYNPSIGRWMTRDPLGELGGINLYGFVGNNPVNFKDPYGLFGDKIIKWLLKKSAKWLMNEFIDENLENPYEGDDDGDGIPNFRDPDSEYCQINCGPPLPELPTTKPPAPEEAC